MLALRGLPGWVPLLAVLALVLAGLYTPAAVGAALLVLVALVVGWLSYLAWPALPPAGRLVRLAAPVLLLVAAVVRVTRG